MSGNKENMKICVKDPTNGSVKEVYLPETKMNIVRRKIEKPFKGRSFSENKKKSSKYWGDKSISDILNEIVEPDSIEVNNLSMKNELCPKIWDGDKMKSDVRTTLLKNAKEFIKFAKIDDLTFKDVILTGSLANYNYTDNSDLDVHILFDFNKISGEKEFVGEYFRTKKGLWTEKYGTTVNGHDVELYVQDTSEPHTSTGVYSLVKNDWLSKPIKKMIGIDTANIQLKSADIMNNIDDLLDNENSIDVVDKVDSIMEKLKKMRASGLEKEGEFSNENLVFKVLRNNGYLEKLSDIKKNSIKKELTLEGFSVKNNINEADIKSIVDKAKKVGLLSLGMVVGLLATNISTQQLRDSGVPQEMLIKAERFVKNIGQEYFNQTQNKTDINQTVLK